MVLSNEQFVQLEAIKMYQKIGESGKDTFVVGTVSGLTITK